jgi:hypothetical protein
MAVLDKTGRIGFAAPGRLPAGALRAELAAIFERIQAEPTPEHLLRLVDRLEGGTTAAGEGGGSLS